MLLLVQVPPAVGSVSVMVEPWHTLGIPDIGAGDVLTVTVADRRQPVDKV